MQMQEVRVNTPPMKKDADKPDKTMQFVAERLRIARQAAHFETALDFCQSKGPGYGISYPTYIGHENGSRGIRLEVLRKYATIFGVRLQWLLEGTGEMSLGGDEDAVISPVPVGYGMQDKSRDFVGADPAKQIPIYGYAAGAGGKAALNLDQRAEGYAMPLPTVVGIKDVFALRIIGDSMEPRYREGEVVYVNPHRFPQRGDDCIIVFHDGMAEIKQYIKSSGHNLHFHQLNPDGEITRKRQDVKGLYSIVGRLNY